MPWILSQYAHKILYIQSQHAHRILSQYAHRNDRIRYIQVTIGYEHIQVTIHTIYKITQITHPVYTSHITYNT
ncbi:hypothetical protein GLOIN_2v1641637 [Rhizophagus irregularis DAOM 181602=DAOM 197198]|nr:hypothetical protein GLOIN_2v1641637 [Rhizophagus irregularis DAOM 181602=DAOM 197198]